MSLTSTFAMSTSSPSITATTAAPATTADPALFGWSSVQNDFYSGTPVYSPGSCQVGFTFAASSTFAACCGTAAPCSIYSSCSGGNVLMGASGSSICGPLSTCKTDYIYQTSIDGSEGSPTSALYCQTGLGATWYRSLPTPGIALSAVPTQSGSSVPWGGVGGGIGASIVFIICCIFLCYFLKKCARGHGGGYPSGRYPSAPSWPSPRNNYPTNDPNEALNDWNNQLAEGRQRESDRKREEEWQAERDREQDRRRDEEQALQNQPNQNY